MIKPPYLKSDAIKLASLLLNSHKEAFGYPLFTNQITNLSNSEKLFAMPIFVIAHDNQQDPIVNYANAFALQLWERKWEEMIGMPSRLTAPKEEQDKRAKAIQTAKLNDYIKNYQGIRITSKGRYFLIQDARIWTVWDKTNKVFGQAAAFSKIDWMEP